MGEGVISASELRFKVTILIRSGAPLVYEKVNECAPDPSGRWLIIKCDTPDPGRAIMIPTERVESVLIEVGE